MVRCRNDISTLMKASKLSTLFFGLILMGSSAFAQNQSDSSAPQRETDNLRQRADLAAHSIEKVCGVDDKADLNALGQACYEYELAKSVLGENANPQQLERTEADFSQAVKRIVGAQKMEAFENWKQSPKLYEKEDYK